MCAPPRPQALLDECYGDDWWMSWWSFNLDLGQGHDTVSRKEHPIYNVLASDVSEWKVQACYT